MWCNLDPDIYSTSDVTLTQSAEFYSSRHPYRGVTVIYDYAERKAEPVSVPAPVQQVGGMVETGRQESLVREELLPLLPVLLSELEK